MPANVDMSGNVTQMIWKPALIRLTHIPMPGVDEHFACFVDPNAISFIGRMVPRFNNADGTSEQGKGICTLVNCCHYQLFVDESPEVVAMLRDKSLGHEHKPQAA